MLVEANAYDSKHALVATYRNGGWTSIQQAPQPQQYVQPQPQPQQYVAANQDDDSSQDNSDNQNTDTNTDTDSSDDQDDNQTSPWVQMLGAVVGGVVAAKTGDAQAAADIAVASGMDAEQANEAANTIVQNKQAADAAAAERQQQIAQQQAQQQAAIEAARQTEQQRTQRSYTPTQVAKTPPQVTQTSPTPTANYRMATSTPQSTSGSVGPKIDNSRARSNCLSPVREGGATYLDNHCNEVIEFSVCSVGSDNDYYACSAHVNPGYKAGMAYEAGEFGVGPNGRSDTAVSIQNEIVYFGCEDADHLATPVITSVHPVRGVCIVTE
jgi:hypothetical protein